MHKALSALTGRGLRPSEGGIPSAGVLLLWSHHSTPFAGHAQARWRGCALSIEDSLGSSIAGARAVLTSSSCTPASLSLQQHSKCSKDLSPPLSAMTRRFPANSKSERVADWMNMQQAATYSLGDVSSVSEEEQLMMDCSERPVSELGSGKCRLPLVSYTMRAPLKSHRVRSFGDLQNALVPDFEGRSWAPQGSSDEESSDLSSEGVVPGDAGGSLVDAVTLAEWEDRAQQGLFRYDVTACPAKVVPGPYGFIAQFNEGRLSKKRPTEFSIDQVQQPFDAKKFNFTKALQKEALYALEWNEGVIAGAAEFLPVAEVGPSPHLVMINVSPIEYGHILLVPAVLSALPQEVTPATLALALSFCQEADNPYFRLAFNSLGAYGTINHLHFQAYYMAAPFPVERAPTRDFGGFTKLGSVRVSALAEYPVRGLVFEATGQVDDMAALVGSACQRLTAANIPHNLFIVDCGRRLFLYPNAFARAKALKKVPEHILDTQVDPAVFEISGHLILKRAEDFSGFTQDKVWELLSYASATQKEFEHSARVALDLDTLALPL